MIIVELIKDYTYLSNNWKKGDKPTVSKMLAVFLISQGIAKYINEGCGCPGKN